MHRPTRGFGLMETFLARQRFRKASSVITPSLRQGRLLDIGCGSSACFLAREVFAEKHALDQLPKPASCLPSITWHTQDLNRQTRLPFADGQLHVITMLAVMEHLNPERAAELFGECYRCLAAGGLLIVTTPDARSDRLLRVMARLRLVSPAEIHEHTFAYTLPLIGWCFGQASFPIGNVRFGRFELGLNLWATAER